MVPGERIIWGEEMGFVGGISSCLLLLSFLLPFVRLLIVWLGYSKGNYQSPEAVRKVKMEKQVGAATFQ